MLNSFPCKIYKVIKINGNKCHACITSIKRGLVKSRSNRLRLLWDRFRSTTTIWAGALLGLALLVLGNHAVCVFSSHSRSIHVVNRRCEVCIHRSGWYGSHQIALRGEWGFAAEISQPRDTWDEAFCRPLILFSSIELDNIDVLELFATKFSKCNSSSHMC